MPTVDWNDPATWAKGYSSALEPPDGNPDGRAVRIGYSRHKLFAYQAKVAANLIRILSITASDTVVIVGAGFGWTAEAMAALVPGLEVVGTDPTPYIQERKDQDEGADVDAAIVAAGYSPSTGFGAKVKAAFPETGARCRVIVANETLGNNASRGRVRRLFAGNKVTIAISELVLDTMTDAELTDIIGRVAAVDPSNLRVVCHYLATAEYGAYAEFPHNVHTRAEWRNLIDAAGGSDHWLVEMETCCTSRSAGDPWVVR